MAQEDLAGPYKLRVRMLDGERMRYAGETVHLSHVDAKRAIEQGTVEYEAPKAMREFDDPRRIPSMAEFLDEMRTRYPEFVQHREQLRSRYEAETRGKPRPSAAADAAAKAKAEADAKAADEAAAKAKEEADAKAAADAAAAAAAAEQSKTPDTSPTTPPKPDKGKK